MDIVRRIKHNAISINGELFEDLSLDKQRDILIQLITKEKNPTLYKNLLCEFMINVGDVMYYGELDLFYSNYNTQDEYRNSIS